MDSCFYGQVCSISISASACVFCVAGDDLLCARGQ